MDTYTMIKPFDAHVHLRDDAMMACVAPLSARQFSGVIAEPNLSTPITTNALAKAYYERVMASLPDDSAFELHLLGYLTDALEPDEVFDMIVRGPCLGIKFYPRGATTNSDSGITDIRSLYIPGMNAYECIRAVGAAGAVVQLHCELNYDLDRHELDPYDKERYFFEKIMPRILDAHPDVKFSCEHLTSAEGVDFMLKYGGESLGCSITAHHLLADRRDMFRGGLRPHFHCLPPIKRERHRNALLFLLRERHKYVYAGTDSAPHDRRKKEADCCSGGIFTAHAAIECYTKVYEDEVGALDENFAEFMSSRARDFYGLERCTDTVTLTRSSWSVDEEIQYSEHTADIIRPFGFNQMDDAGNPFTLGWKLQD